MRKIMSIVHYEYKMQFKRLATWGLLLVATAIALFDNFPSESNLARLEFLEQPVYFIYRTMSLDALIVVFGLMFLMSNRLSLDNKTGVKTLMMASTVRKGQYLLGKLLGGLLYTFSLICIFLMLNTIVYYCAVPFEINITDCVVPLLKTLAVSALPVSVFISFCSIAIPALIDIRLFYLLAAVLFVFNASFVGTAEAMPFYLITSGDLIRLIWVHPKWSQVDLGSVISNLMFLLGCGLISWVLILVKQRFWRSE